MIDIKVRPHSKFIVAEKNSHVRREDDLICRDQVDMELRPLVLSAFFYRNPSARIFDLMRLLGSVAHVDRRVTRRPSVCWGRDLEIEIPVSDPDFWSSVAPSVEDLLAFLSGDKWSFRFDKLKEPVEFPRQTQLEFPPLGEITTAYSNGLDSFAVARLVASGAIPLNCSGSGPRDIVLVTTGKRINAELKKSPSGFGYNVRQVSVPFSIKKLGDGFQLRESSYRTRAFVFQTMAAVAAAQSEGDTVVVAESGQGSLGPWLTVTGSEVADVRTHPLFTTKLANTLLPIIGRKVKFEHPQLWKTKGQTLKQLVAAKFEQGWNDTFSCAIQVRHQHKSGTQFHCGTCPNCLLRRQSVHAAGLPDSDSDYDYEGTVAADRNYRSVEKLRKRLSLGLFPLVELANIRKSSLTSRVAQKQLLRFAGREGMDAALVRAKADSLIDAHRDELVSFIEGRQKTSLLRKLGEAAL